MSAPAKRTRQTSPTPEALLAILRRRSAHLAPSAVVGVGVYASSGRLWPALLACLLGPPTIAAGRVLTKWVELLEPPRRWRRPRRRGS